MALRDTSCDDTDDDDTDDGNSNYKGVADDDDDDEPQLEGFLSRVARIAAPSRMLRRGEVAGALGDLGTFLPDVVALSKGGVTLLPEPAAMVFFSGLWSAWAGVLFDLPMPIQPMHAVVAVALTEGLSYPQMVASTVWLGGAFLILGSLGLISWCQRVIPLSVVRGLQLGLGLKVFATGVTLALTSCKEWRTSTESALELGLLVISAALAALLYGDRLRPASLVLFVLGLLRAMVVLARYGAPSVELGVFLPLAPLNPLEISADDWMQALYRAALPQLPVTLLNAVISTARLASDLYPGRGRRRAAHRKARGEGACCADPVVDQGPATVTTIAMSIGLMNLSTGWLGHFPSCHGCGGLAAQHLFGARTGSSMLLMGFVKMALALALGPSLATALAAFPNAVLGVLLALSGVELAISCRDMSEKRDTAVMLIGAGLVLRAGTGPAFVVSLLAAAGLKRS